MEEKIPERRSIQQDIEQTVETVQRWRVEAPYLITSSSVARVRRDREVRARQAGLDENAAVTPAPDYQIEAFRRDLHK